MMRLIYNPCLRDCANLQQVAKKRQEANLWFWEISQQKITLCVSVCLSVAGSVVESWAKEEKGQSESF